MTSTYIEPFDFFTILVGYFLGNQELFVYAFVILSSYGGAKMGMSNRLFLTILAIGSALFAAYLGEALYFLILIVVGFLTFKATSNLISR